MSIIDNQSNRSSIYNAGGQPNVFGNAAGQDLTNRPNMNRQMADFNINSKPTNNTYRLQQLHQHDKVVPVAAQSQCELHPQVADDNRSEYSVRTHSQFGQQSAYFSNYQPAGYGNPAAFATQHSPLSHAGVVQNRREQQATLERYNEKAQ